MKKRTFWVLAAGVALVAVGAAAVGLLVLLLRSSGAVPRLGGRTYLDLSLHGTLPERPPPDLGLPFERHAPSLRTYVESLDRAAGDPAVGGVVLRLGRLSDGWGRFQELRDALARFRRSGKPAWAHLEDAGNAEYYVASACDKIYAAPTALLGVTGLATEVTFFRGTLDKLGVEAQFEGVGKYKNAPDQFTQRGFSEPYREQTEALLDSLDAQFVEALAQGRGRPAEEVRAWIDGGPHGAQDAQRLGLVDELLYRDELEQRLTGARIAPAAYARRGRGLGLGGFGRPKVALLYVLGEIVAGHSDSGPFGGESAGSETLAAALREARSDDAIRAVVIRVDSPGGSGTASDAIWREVRETRGSKPVVVSMGDVAASGGYYVAMAADEIVAQPGTITGSIGVFGGKFSLRGLYDKLGMDKELVARGRRAAMWSDYRPWNADERAAVRGLMESFYRDFVGRVAEERGKSFEEIDAVAQGRVWTGADAHARGLVDRLGGLRVAIDRAKERAGIAAGQEVEIVVLPARKGLFDMLFDQQEDVELAAARLLPPEARALLRFAATAAPGPIARLPYEVRVF